MGLGAERRAADLAGEVEWHWGNEMLIGGMPSTIVLHYLLVKFGHSRFITDD